MVSSKGWLSLPRKLDFREPQNSETFYLKKPKKRINRLTSCFELTWSGNDCQEIFRVCYTPPAFQTASFHVEQGLSQIDLVGQNDRYDS